MEAKTALLGRRLAAVIREHPLNIAAYSNGDQGCTCGKRVASHEEHVGQVLAMEAVYWAGVDSSGGTGVTSVP